MTDPTGASFPIAITGSANQVVTITGVGTITFNERTTAPGALTVTGARINFTVGGTTYNVAVATSHSDIICPGVVVTAAPVNVSGRVVDQNGTGIYRATVTITNTQGTVVKTALSNSLGYFLLSGVDSGAVYIVSATHKSYDFAPRSLNLLDEVSGFNLVGTPK